MASSDEAIDVTDAADAPAKEVPVEGSSTGVDNPGGNDRHAGMTEEDIKGITKIQATYRGHLVRKQRAAPSAADKAGAEAEPEEAASAADGAAGGEPAVVPAAPASDVDTDLAEEPAADVAEKEPAKPNVEDAPTPPAKDTAAAAAADDDDDDDDDAEDKAAAAKAATTIQATFRGHQVRKEVAASKKATGAAGTPQEEAAEAAPADAATEAAAADAAAEAAAADAPAEPAAADAAAEPSAADTAAADAAAADADADEAADTAAADAAKPTDVDAAAKRTAEAAAEAAAEAVIVVCGPSGVGKGTLIGRLMKDYPQRFGFSVSHTTRGPRPGEEDGVHYHFRSKEEVLEGVQAGLFLEHAEVHGNVYGTSIAAAQAVAKQGKLCVLDIDTQGAEQVKKSPYGPKALFLFVAPPSMEELERRLRGRGTETEDKIATRLKNAHAEMAKCKEPGFFTKVIVNNDLDTAYSDFKAAIRCHIPNSIPTDPPAAKPAPASSTTPAPATLKSSVLDALLTSPSRPWASDDMRGLPVRQYMNETVVPVLREALRALNKGRPEDPLQFVADFVLAERQKLIQKGEY